MMSKRCKYALKALARLGRAFEKIPNSVPTPEIARGENIPKKFLEQILLELKKGGLVDSRAGASGGYFLLKAPAEISLIEVLRLVDGPVALLSCVSTKFYKRCDDCPDEAACTLRRVFTEVRQRDVELLAGFSIAHLMN
jgi:Rrf2 family protein